MGNGGSVVRDGLGVVEVDAGDVEAGVGPTKRLRGREGGLQETPYPDTGSHLYRFFLRGVERKWADPCFGWRMAGVDGKLGAFRWQPYAEVFAHAEALASEVRSRNFLPEPIHDAVTKKTMRPLAICSRNRREWLLTALATLREGGTVVPLYPTSDAATITYQLGLTQVSTIAVEDGATLAKVLDAVAAGRAKDTAPSSAEVHGAVPPPAVGDAPLVASPDDLREEEGGAARGGGGRDAGDAEAAAEGSGETRRVVVERAVVFGAYTDADAARAKEVGVELIVFEDLVDKNAPADKLMRQVGAAKAGEETGTSLDSIQGAPEDPAVICFTSGSTGMPKGAVLTHANFVAAIGNPGSVGNGVGPTDVALSYLPLAHVFEFAVSFALLAEGAAIGFYSGDIRKFLDDVQELEPTVFVAVPRVLDMLRTRVMARIDNGTPLRRGLVHGALQGRLAALETHGFAPSIYDQLLGRIRAQLGLRRCRAILSGSAPLSAETCQWFRAIIAGPVSQGYGATEHAAGATCSDPADAVSAGHIGFPMASVEVRLVSTGDFSIKDTVHGATGAVCRGRGEIQVRGPNVFAGYWAAPEQTADAFTADGFHKTGDVGYWSPEGRLVIVDRVKSVFKLAQGEYVSPEQVEAVLRESPFVMHAFVDGFSTERYPVAVVTLDMDAIRTDRAALLPGTSADALDKTLADPSFAKRLHADFKAMCRKAGLPSFATPQGVHVHPEPFSVDNGLLTPTMKLRRAAARARFLDVMTALYRA